VLGAAIGVAALALATQSSGQEVAAAGPWFTTEQAERGDDIFVIECGGCHGYDLADVLAEATTADAFFSYISTTMPWENPGDLRLQQYADIVAFFLGELGFAPGDTELLPDREIMALIIPADAAIEVAQADGAAAGAVITWYTAEQADQGQRDFAIACGGCHGAEMVDLFREYETVERYFQFITGAMPQDDPGNLAMRQYVAITAYLMREVGFPAGDTELTNDRELLGQIIPADGAAN
jgi:mono/diheme cytochrome c family protein